MILKWQEIQLILSILQHSGPPRTTRVKAKRAVCMAMCRRLHEDGLLDESLFPRKKTLDAFIDELDCSNSGLPKIGTKRSKSYYEIQSPMELKFVYSEKATKFCEISTLLLSAVHTLTCQIIVQEILLFFRKTHTYTTLLGPTRLLISEKTSHLHCY